jgi:hypothetical protein
LWWRQGIGILLAAVALGALVAALLAWLIGPLAGLPGFGLVLLGGLGLVMARPPHAAHAARRADRELDLANRLATANEILEGRLSGFLSHRQLADTWSVCQALVPGRVFGRGSTRLVEIGVAAAAALVLLGVVLVQRPPVPVVDTGSTDASTLAAAAEPTPVAATLADAALAEPPIRSAAAEAALERLGDALRPTTAAHDVAESLQRGNSDEAAQRLRDLAQNSDQLSMPARRELARALDIAARTTTPLSQPMAKAEQDSAAALQRMQYEPERAALEKLAETVQKTGNGTLPPELAKAQQAAADAKPGEQQNGQQGGGEDDPNAPYGNEKGLRPGQESIQSSNSKGDDVIASPVNAKSRLGRISAGLEVGGNPIGDPTNPLAINGVPLSLDNIFVDDRGKGPAKPDAPIVKITDSPQTGVDQPGVDQTTEPVQAASEQTRESASRRQVVRTFFDPRDRGPR